VTDAGPLLIAHVGHWVRELLVMAPGRDARDEKERAERELDEILSS
jgi:hypothetical protein